MELECQMQTEFDSLFNGLCSISLDKFAENYGKYPLTVSAIYHIVRDLFIKQEVQNIFLSDGCILGVESYIIECVTKIGNIKKVMLPCSADQDIDLSWLRWFSRICQNKSSELIVCIYTPESIM